MDFGTTISYVSFYLVSLAIAYYFFTTRNKERMALIEAGANPDMFQSSERYYMLFITGTVAVGLSLGLLIGKLSIYCFDVKEGKTTIYLASILAFGGGALISSFFIIIQWLKRSKQQNNLSDKKQI